MQSLLSKMRILTKLNVPKNEMHSYKLHTFRYHVNQFLKYFNFILQRNKWGSERTGENFKLHLFFVPCSVKLGISLLP